MPLPHDICLKDPTSILVCSPQEYLRLGCRKATNQGQNRVGKAKDRAKVKIQSCCDASDDPSLHHLEALLERICAGPLPFPKPSTFSSCPSVVDISCYESRPDHGLR